jgi:hypothetical protein
MVLRGGIGGNIMQNEELINALRSDAEWRANGDYQGTTKAVEKT